jgi:quercetin dioxygenase-like cupin family protein
VNTRGTLFIVVLLVTGFAYTATATPGSGAERKNLATASVVQGGAVDIAEKTGVVADAVTLSPGGTSGWHTHPAPELVLVKSGELTFYRSDVPVCLAGTFRAGHAVVGPPGGVPQMATNTGDVPTDLVVVFFGIPEGGEVRDDTDVPADCPAK